MKCSDIECYQNDQLLLLCIPQYVGPLNPFEEGNGKIRFPNPRISLVYGCSTIGSSSRIEFLHLINLIFLNEKYCYSVTISHINISY